MQTSEYFLMHKLEKTHWWFSARRLFFKEIFKRFDIESSQSKNIADIGAGTGGMISFLSQFGKVIGVEPNKVGRYLARKNGIILRKGNASNTGLQAKYFDIVCFVDVLYHQNIEEFEALKEAFRILKPHGYVVISDSAFAFLTSPHDVAMQGQRRYTRGQLCALVKQAGFSVEYSTYSFFLVFPVVVTWRILRVAIAKWQKSNNYASDVNDVSIILNYILLSICKIESFVYRISSFPWGSSVVVIAQKKV